jgi:hypothetical protein
VSLVIPYDCPDEFQADFNACAADVDLAVQAFFRIRDMDGQLVQFIFNRAQRLLAERSSGHQFVIVLKARKVGVSSRRFASDLWQCATRKHQHRILLTHNDEAAIKLLDEKIKPLHDNCLIPLGGVFKRSEGMFFFPRTDSYYYVGTAGAKAFARGDDITGRHFSEQAWWESPGVIAGVDEAMVEGGDGLTETTANGYNFFKVDWEKAKRGNSRDHAIFLPWMVHERYEDDATGLVTGGAEAELAKALGLTARQIAWRRRKISEMRDPSLFPQEYPETDSQAFLSSGRPVFDWLGLARAKDKCEKPRHRGHLERRGNRVELVEDPAYGAEVAEEHRGRLKVWALPKYGHVYAIGCDVAEGIEGGAYSTGEVLDLGTGTQVAEWHGHLAPDLFGEEMTLLSAWYNQAVLIPEAWPGPGGTTEARMIQLEANVWKNPDRDTERDGLDGTQGWRTTKASKPRMIHAFNAAIRDREFVMKSVDLLDECHAYRYADSGEMVPSIGQFSDRLMGMAIAWYASREMAAKIDYDRAPRTADIGRPERAGTSVPRFQGPRFGVRARE